MASLIVSCATESKSSRFFHSATANNLVASPTAVSYSPANVIIYRNAIALDKKVYKKIAVIKVALYNQYGIRRQQAQINQLLKERAYTLGGDAVLLIQPQTQKYLYAHILRSAQA